MGIGTPFHKIPCLYCQVALVGRTWGWWLLSLSLRATSYFLLSLILPWLRCLGCQWLSFVPFFPDPYCFRTDYGNSAFSLFSSLHFRLTGFYKNAIGAVRWVLFGLAINVYWAIHCLRWATSECTFWSTCIFLFLICLFALDNFAVIFSRPLTCLI